MIPVLLPRFDHPAIEERYAAWQAEKLLRAQTSELHYYDAGEPAAEVAIGIDAAHVLVITDPLVLSSANLVRRLASILGDADAALPMTNETLHPMQQRAPMKPYMTMRELEREIRNVEEQPPQVLATTWTDADPAAFLCHTDLLKRTHAPLHKALHGRKVVVSTSDYVHRWSSMRGQVRYDLLNRIDTDARSVLEFGCGEAPLGAALKSRQRCRVVGVELDRDAAAIARNRIDDVYQGDVREIIAILREQFDWIIGGDIIEHLDDPWSFLADLRRLSVPGGHLLLSLPNLSNASIVADLLQGRFDYVYMGLTCVGHVRFFTRRSIEDLLSISGWAPVEITTQELAVTAEANELMERLTAANIPFSRQDLTASGYYVVARNG
jgi:2-polyprenyl-3-methyl-5-hydroxy-6-metoxy-1,4-benzoquinol methylase